MSCAKRSGPVGGRSCRTEEGKQLADEIVGIAGNDWVLGKRKSGKNEGNGDDKDRESDHGGETQ
jgi:hypothetical protein